jgi:hypothetical protein
LLYNPERLEEDLIAAEIAEQEKIYSKFFKPINNHFDYSHGKIRVRFRSFNYQYFTDVKDQQALIDYFGKN